MAGDNFIDYPDLKGDYPATRQGFTDVMYGRMSLVLGTIIKPFGLDCEGKFAVTAGTEPVEPAFIDFMALTHEFPQVARRVQFGGIAVVGFVRDKPRVVGFQSVGMRSVGIEGQNPSEWMVDPTLPFDLSPHINPAPRPHGQLIDRAGTVLETWCEAATGHFALLDSGAYELNANGLLVETKV